jgi:hypothetical protein
MRVLVLLGYTVAIYGCAGPQQWCDDNPRQCEAAVIAGGVLVACAVSAVAVSFAHTGAHTHYTPPVAPITIPPCDLNPGACTS